jgi:hypothetical protein
MIHRTICSCLVKSRTRFNIETNPVVSQSRNDNPCDLAGDDSGLNDNPLVANPGLKAPNLPYTKGSVWRGGDFRTAPSHPAEDKPVKIPKHLRHGTETSP